MPPHRFFEVVEAALAGGVDTVLVRERQMNSAQLLAFASRLRSLTREAGAHLVIHTQADIALAVEADGVHVAANGIGELPAIRDWIGQTPMSLSASCHNRAEIRWAHAMGADFAFLSPVFPTKSHPETSPLGPARFRAMAHSSPLPIIALGGITPENRQQLAGYSVAVIDAILSAADPESAARGLLDA
jgi:thiamine-phosphate diphosphorylase